MKKAECMTTCHMGDQDPGNGKNPYCPIVLHLIPRILTNLDRDRDSPTYGCFDRAFWNYKVHDYASAILQQCSLTLALVYTHPFHGNMYHNQEKIREYAISGIQFWKKIQHRNGSFDEYWKGEQSIPATAFTLSAMCEVCEVLGIEPDRTCIGKAVHFLEHHEQPRHFEAMNQLTASVCAIHHAGKVLGNDDYLDLADNTFDTLVLRQKKEGWFSELGGFDPAYSTVNLDYMVRYYEQSNNPEALKSAGKLLNLIQYFVHPDGSFGGEYGTRNTEYFAPYGIEYLKRHWNISHTIIDALLGYIHQDTYLNLNCDERYYLHYLSHSFAKALLIYSHEPCTEKLPCEMNFGRYFDESGIFIKSTDDYYFIASLGKGGVFKVMDKNTLAMSTDCGYRFFTGKNCYVTELMGNTTYAVTGDTLEISAPFTRHVFIRQSPAKLWFLRMLSSLFGFHAVRLVKRILAQPAGHTGDMYLYRKIILEDQCIHISDAIVVPGKSGVLKQSDGLSVTRTSSSRFFQPASLKNDIEPEVFSIQDGMRRERTFLFHGDCDL